MSSSSSYGIVRRRSRTYIVVNARYGDPLDVIFDMTPGENKRELLKIHDYYEGIETILFDDGPRFEIYRLIFTSDNNGSIVTSRYMPYSPSGEVKDHVMDEFDYQTSIRYARFVLWAVNLFKDLPKATEDAVKISRFHVKEILDDEEEYDICVICHEEYQADSMIGTLGCKHSYHEGCIKNWFTENDRCPICRSSIFSFV